MNVWIEFALCAAVILYAGSRLSIYGDGIADKTGLGRSWIGLVLLATVTSLPELITGVSAVTMHDVPDVAVSGTIGSCMFNVMVIAFLDLLSKHKPVSLIVHQGHMISCGFGIVLLGLVGLDIGFGKQFPTVQLGNPVGIFSLLYIPVYLFAMRLIYEHEKARPISVVEEAVHSSLESKSLQQLSFYFALHSILIVAAACFLPGIAEEIAKQTGRGQSLIGSSFIAITTSLPEITVCVAAARLGAFDMAVGNLLGSNLFNVAILSVTDFCYSKGAIMPKVSFMNMATALCAMAALAIVVIGLTYRSEKKFWFLAGDAIAICLIYALCCFILVGA